MVNFPEYAAGAEVTRQATLLARSSAVPESIIGVMEVAWGGRILPLPGDRQFGEFTLTFIEVNDHKVRDAFERWSEAINGSESNTCGVAGLDNMLRDIQLDLLQCDDSVTRTYFLKDAWPTVVGPIELDAGALDSYAEYQVTFRYLTVASPATR